MNPSARNTQIALAVAVALSASQLAAAANDTLYRSGGTYAAGDFHNHTTCSDGSISMQKLVKKATDTTDTPWGLDWFVQAGHGGSGNRNCTLVEDETLATPAYPVVYASDGTIMGPTTPWVTSGVTPKGLVSGSGTNQVMWRWQSVQEFQYPLIEYLNAYKDLPLFIGLETVAPGHEHVSMSIITGQIPASLATRALPTTPGYSALGNANALAQWEYCFDRADTDTSRGDTAVGSGIGNNWDCSVPGSANASDVNWNATAAKLMPASGTGSGTAGHAKTLEALKWMAAYHPSTSYYVPAHLERAGPFNPNGNNGFNIEDLRDFNNAAPKTAFGFESQPGHGASSNRGEYQVKRNTINGVQTDSVGGTTYGGTGVYAAWVGGVWDALLGEGRNWWFFASSDWHNRGSFGSDDRRSTQDFYPGEYQRTYALVRNADSSAHPVSFRGKDEQYRPQQIVDALRTGNAFSTGGQLIDRLGFVACAVTSVPDTKGGRIVRRAQNLAVESLAVASATRNSSLDSGAQCAGMGEKLSARKGSDIVISIVVRDPAGKNYSPYTFANPSLLQVGIKRPINEPALDHIDLIRGMVTGYRQPGSADYAGAWPTNTAWLHTDGTTADLSAVPDAAKNTTAAVLYTFSDGGSWTSFRSSVDGTKFLKMTYRIPAVQASQYVRLRGTNMPAAVPYETDANGNPLSDIYTNANDPTMLHIPCTTVGTVLSGDAIDGCPAHLATVNGQKYVSYDVAAWSDLWFYSNPIYVQVSGSTPVAGVL